MTERFDDGFKTAVERVERGSDKALYPYLNIGVFGPYAGDCEAYLREITLRLQERGFQRAKIAADRGVNIPDDYEGTREEFWHQDSMQYLDQCDAAIFFFLTNEVQRRYVPVRAFKSEPTERDGSPQDMNGSATVELEEWIDIVENPEEKTLIIYEKECYEEVATLLDGEVKNVGLEYRVAENHDINSAFDFVEAFSPNWAMNQFKSRLQARYLADR